MGRRIGRGLRRAIERKFHHRHRSSGGEEASNVHSNDEISSLRNEYNELKKQYDELNKQWNSRNSNTANTNTSSATPKYLTLEDIETLLNKRDKERMDRENAEREKAKANAGIPASDSELNAKKNANANDLALSRESENPSSRIENNKINNQYGTNRLTSDNFNFINTLKKEYRDRNKYGYSVRDWWANTRDKLKKVI